MGRKPSNSGVSVEQDTHDDPHGPEESATGRHFRSEKGPQKPHSGVGHIDFGIVGTGDLAVILGISERTVLNLAKEGVLIQVERGKYMLPRAVQGYLVYKQRGSKANPQQGAAKLGIDGEKLRRLKRENDLEDEIVLPADDVRAVYRETLVAIRTQVDAVAGRCANEWAGIDDPNVLRAKILQENRIALAAASDRLAAMADGGIGGGVAEAAAG